MTNPGTISLHFNLMGKEKIIKRIGFTFAGLFAGSLALVVFVNILNRFGGSSQANTRIGGFRAPDVGETQFVGKSNCDKAVRGQLRDPDSYQNISSQIVDVKAGAGWVAQVGFRARNGFGGYQEGAAYCVFDGKQYRALLN
jgi:hypothetical protein